MSTLVARDISRTHGTHVVLSKVGLTVGPRSRIGVVGPNGVGKSTLLRILAGTEEPDGGAVTRTPPTATVGWLPQEPERREDERLHDFLARRTGVAAAQDEMEEAAAALAEAAPGADERYSIALETWLALGGADLDARIGVVCDDLGIKLTLLDQGMATLSGGEVARAQLAAILLSRFDVFLLDEPTNDLDFAGLDRLERFLDDLPGGVVVVSHDRAFLQRTITSVLEIDEHEHTASLFAGGWDAFLELRATARRHAEEAYGTYVDQRDQLKGRAQQQREWAQQGRSKVKKSDESDKFIRHFKTVQTEKLAGKARATEKMLERLEVVEKPWEGWDLRLEFAAAPRSGDVVARLHGAVVERGGFRLGPIDEEIAWGERVAILGPNGSGKTTLLQALLGRLPLTSGTQVLGPGVVVGELDQRRSRLTSGDTLLAAFTAESGLLPQEARSMLAKLGLAAEHVARPASSLSPGERTRAQLGVLAATGVNCLVLDEPTNHLDLPAIEQLEQALDRFPGTVLLVTHDRRLLETVRTTRTISLG